MVEAGNFVPGAQITAASKVVYRLYGFGHAQATAQQHGPHKPQHSIHNISSLNPASGILPTLAALWAYRSVLPIRKAHAGYRTDCFHERPYRNRDAVTGGLVTGCAGRAAARLGGA